MAYVKTGRPNGRPPMILKDMPVKPCTRPCCNGIITKLKTDSYEKFEKRGNCSRQCLALHVRLRNVMKPPKVKAKVVKTVATVAKEVQVETKDYTLEPPPHIAAFIRNRMMLGAVK